MVERRASHLGGKIIAVSGQTKKDLEKLGVNKQITVIPNGIDFERIQGINPNMDRPGWDILFTGRLIKEKNIGILIRAIQCIKEQISDVKCAIIGEGPERENIERLILDLNLQYNVAMLGRVVEDAHVYSFMKSSKVFVSPSTREGFGIVALEANACGLPVITVKHPRNAMCDLIIDGENGYLCILSAQDIAEKTLFAIRHGNTMRNKCLKFAENYEWSKICNEIELFYKDALSK